MAQFFLGKVINYVAELLVVKGVGKTKTFEKIVYHVEKDGIKGAGKLVNEAKASLKGSKKAKGRQAPTTKMGLFRQLMMDEFKQDLGVAGKPGKSAAQKQT